MHKQAQLVQMVWLVKLDHTVKVGKTHKLAKLAILDKVVKTR